MQYFGTDGIRGVVGEKLTEDLARRIGVAYGRALWDAGTKGKILLGRDTRSSGKMLCEAVCCGLNKMGFDVVDAGIITTPAHNYLTNAGDFVGGVMITASHNPASHNGIKLCDQHGKKYSIEFLENVERYLSGADDFAAERRGVVSASVDLGLDWVDFILKSLDYPDLRGLRVALDLANGAGFALVPEGFRRAGAEVIVCNGESDGVNINSNCGSVNVDKFVPVVLHNRADVGFSFDGDADRIMAVDRHGRIIDGTDIMYILGMYYAEKGKLVGDTVVSTIITNQGLENSLVRNGLRLSRTAVGGQYVQREMDSRGFVIGGEENGHMMLADIGEGSDGMCIGLYLLKIMREKNCDLGDLLAGLVRTNVAKSDLTVTEAQKQKVNDGAAADFVDEQQKRLNGGRIIVRTSGTECVVRVLVEGQDQALLDQICSDIVDFILAL